MQKIGKQVTKTAQLIVDKSDALTFLHPYREKIPFYSQEVSKYLPYMVKLTKAPTFKVAKPIYNPSTKDISLPFKGFSMGIGNNLRPKTSI